MYTERQSEPELFLAVRRVSSSTSRKVFERIVKAALWSTASGLTKGSFDWTFGRVRGPELGPLDVDTENWDITFANSMSHTDGN